MKNVKFITFTVMSLSLSLGFWMCESELAHSDSVKSQIALQKDRVVKGENSIMVLDVCADPEPSSLYLYSYGTSTFYISPKLDGSFGSEQITLGGLSCFQGAYGYTCDNGPGYSGACVFTIDQSINCTGKVYQVLEDQSYTVTPYIPVTSPCIGSSFTFSINCEDEIQSVRFCTNECFTQMCYGLQCIDVDINN